MDKANAYKRQYQRYKSGEIDDEEMMDYCWNEFSSIVSANSGILRKINDDHDPPSSAGGLAIT